MSRLSLIVPWEPPPALGTESARDAQPATASFVVEAQPTAAVVAEPSQREWALAALNAYQSPLLRFATSLVGSEVAQDIVQETFLELCRADRRSVGAHLRPWLFTVCRNRALDWQRRARRQAPLATTDASQAHPPERTELGPACLLEHKQAALQMETLLQRLPQRQREALLLKFSADLSYKEIAQTLQTTVSNVGVLLHAAVTSLRAALRTQAELSDGDGGGDVD